MNWHDPHYVAWVCEQIGVEYKGLPLTHQQKLRFLSLTQKSKLEYVPPTRKNIIMTTQQPVPPATSKTAEDTLISQYDREIASLDAKESKYKTMMEEVKMLRASLIKKRKAIAKILVPVKGA